VAECIHGFDEGMCDICFPRTSPEPAAAATAASTTRTAERPKRVVRPAAGRAPASRPAGTPTKVPPFASRRLYHWTPLANLESILLDGAVKPVAAGIEPDVDVAAPLVRQLRGHRDVGDGRHVDEFVPFAATPDAERWSELREGAEEPHWSAAARQLGAADYALLVAVGRDLGADLVVADGDAGAQPTVFTVGDAAPALARAARSDPELTGAEVLVGQEVPLAAITLIAVANEPARARVRRMFADVDGTPPKVVVHPPWFGA
jgi:hypothetical protein